MANCRSIDSHVHLDHILDQHPERICWLCDHQCTPISWSFSLAVSDRNDVAAYLKRHLGIIRQLNYQGLRCYFLAGIHPRNVTDDLTPEHVPPMISPLLKSSFCLGIGEVGLETGSKKEVDILMAQIQLFTTLSDKEKRLGIHTPRANKVHITDQTLEILEEFPDIRDKTVIDHCTPETIGKVLDAGYWAGVTLSPIKLSISQLITIVEKYPDACHRILCNTDSGTAVYNDLVDILNSDLLAQDVKKRILYENATRFFSLEERSVIHDSGCLFYRDRPHSYSNYL